MKYTEQLQELMKVALENPQLQLRTYEVGDDEFATLGGFYFEGDCGSWISIYTTDDTESGMQVAENTCEYVKELANTIIS